MKGQWIGTFAGTNEGLCVLDIDETDDGWEGHAFAFDGNPQIPSVMFRLKTDVKSLPLTVISREIAALHPIEARAVGSQELEENFQGISMPTSIELHINKAENQLFVEWTSNVETKGSAMLKCPDAAAGSDYIPLKEVSHWDEFVKWALDLPPHRFIFRGQGTRHRLRTSFHRSRRKDLVKYLLTDLNRAHHVLTAQTRHFFNLGQPVENAAFLNLLQHHGFPTPLLDWTHSPFVAAFFAYRYGRRRSSDDPHVRIYIFDREQWESDFNQVQTLAFARPHFSILEASALENPRALPQQSISSVTNVDDIETYIRGCETQRGKTYLQAVDLSYSERRRVMEQLRKMGITAGSLFPGLDGACEELRGRFFHPLG